MSTFLSDGCQESYIVDLFDFTGKMSKIDLVALHGFGECGKRTYASSPFPRPDEPKIGQPPHIVPGKTSIRFGIHGHISQYCKPYLLFLTCTRISDILNVSAQAYV